MDPLKIIIIDDTEDIHANIKILFRPKESEDNLEKLSQEIFGKSSCEVVRKDFVDLKIDSAYQGQEGYEMIKEAMEQGEPYSVAVVDMRMPPGWDGLKTIDAIRTVDEDIEIIISSAYSDYSWQDIADRLGISNKYLFLSKPFEVAEMKQMIVALGQKWWLNQQNQKHIHELKQAYDAVETAIRAKEDFLSVMGHELRTPLNIIIMTLEDFLETEKNPSNARILKNSEESAKYLARLIDNLMYYIQLDSHSFKSESTNFKVNDLIDEVLELIPMSKDEKFNLSIEVDEETPNVNIDRKRMRIALLQVIDNALKFSDQGDIFIKAKVKSTGKNKLDLIFNVIDSGIGMGKVEREQAFELFFQGESANHHSRTGTGVGLSLCKKIVESLGGNISLLSEQGKGSEVLITIPIDKA